MQEKQDKSQEMLIAALRKALKEAQAVVIGAGAGLSISAGFSMSGPRFYEHFQDFADAYGFQDMYSGGFYPFDTLEEYWAYWSRYIELNRYSPARYPVYERLLELVQGKDYFVITTNVDHQFQRAGFDHHRLFYMQGDYGLWQCSVPCHQKTYDNEALVHEMVRSQTNLRIPSRLVPRCPPLRQTDEYESADRRHLCRGSRLACGSPALWRFSPAACAQKNFVFGAGGGTEYAGDYKIPFLADDGAKSPGHVCLPESR